MALDKQHLYDMRMEFAETYGEMFNEGFQNLHKTMSIKLFAIENCQARLEKWSTRPSSEKGDLKYDLKVLTVEDVEKMDFEQIQDLY